MVWIKSAKIVLVQEGINPKKAKLSCRKLNPSSLAGRTLEYIMKEHQKVAQTEGQPEGLFRNGQTSTIKNLLHY